MYRVDFKNKSTDDFQVVTKDIGRRKRANEQIDRYTSPYHNGELTVHTNKYDSYSRNMTFTSLDDSELSDIYKWLNGYGKLRTSIDPDGFFYASVIGEVEAVADGPILNDLSIEFSVEPFFYLDSGDSVVEVENGAVMTNLGSFQASPLITIYGEGDITLSINGKSVLLENVVDSISMDSLKLVCYRGNENMGRKMIGEYLFLEEGENEISYQGTVMKVEITPRWCEK